MDKEALIKAVEEAKKNSKKRKFLQSIDLAVNLKDYDIKREGKIEEFVELPFGLGKELKICAFVGPELKEQAEKLCHKVIISDDFTKWTDTRKCKKLGRECDFFIAQANIMPAVAKTFGRFLGVLGKMPNPKVGQIVPPKANLEPLIKRLSKTVRLVASKSPVIHCIIGKEDMPNEQLVENILAILEKLKARLPKGEGNIASMVIKTTMGKPIKVGGKSGKA